MSALNAARLLDLASVMPVVVLHDADLSVPLAEALPGAATASEVLRLLERGHPEMKFFPAEASGGIAVLRALSGPIPEARFCPTGGITLASAPT